MSLLMGTRSAGMEREAESRKAGQELGRADFRVRLVKVVCAIVLGVLFWYSVPYELGMKVDPDPAVAAANEAQAYQGNFSRQVAMPIIFLIAAFLLWRLPKRGRIGGRLLIVMVLYVSWAMLSFAWADDPAITAKRLVVFATDAMFAYTIARICSVMEMALWGFACTGIVGLISLYVDVFQEKIFAPFDPDYRFMGVMTANYQAMNLLVCMLCGVIVLEKKPHWARWMAPSLLLAMVLMYLTRARSGSIIGLLLLGFAVVRLMRRQLRPQARALVLVGALAVATPALILIFGRDGGEALQSAFMMGRNDTQNTSNLSNRAPLWAELWESVEQRPWLGFGFSGFWLPERVEKISADQGWTVPHAHNTYLDETLALGVIGAGLYAGMLFGALVVAWKRYRKTGAGEDLLPALLLSWMALISMTESIPLDPYLPTMLGYACIVKMCLAEGSEKESDAWLRPGEIVGGLTPRLLKDEPELAALMEESGRVARAG
jgi:exopolysaccharide production protein ExoQ